MPAQGATSAITPRPPVLQMESLADPAELGRMLAASGYFHDVNEAAQAIVKVLAGAELGIPPIAAMTGVSIVKGRVTLGANLIANLIKRQRPRYDFRVADLTDERCEIVFLQDGEQIGTSVFTLEDAKKAGISGGENWRHYPRNMLFARAISNGAKWFVPDVFAGAPIYTPDELGAETDPETGEIIALPPGQIVEMAGHAVDRHTGEIKDPPKPKPQPTPQPAPEPAPEPKPETPQPQTDNGAGDETGQINNAEFAKLLELLDALKAPESFRRMAAMASGVEDLAQLTRAQARDVAAKAQARFGS